MSKRIIDYPEASELEEDDYLILESVNGGTCKILAKPLEPIKPEYITAVYTQSGTVYDTDELDVLIPDLVVTAYYEDGTVESNVSGYILSGELTVGESVITCTYRGKSATFTVTVSSYINYLYNWDFTQSLTDSVAGVTANLSNATFTQGVGVVSNNANSIVNVSVSNLTGKTLEIDFASLEKGNSNSIISLLRYGDNVFSFVTNNKIWIARRFNSQQAYTLTSNQTSFANATFKFIFSSEHLSVTVNDEAFYEGGTFVAPTGNISLNIGYNPAGFGNFTITGVRIYENE